MTDAAARAANKRLQSRLGEVKGLRQHEIIAAPTRITIDKGRQDQDTGRKVNNYPAPQPFILRVYEGRAMLAERRFNRTRSLHQTLGERLWRAAFKAAQEHPESDAVVIYAGENGVDFDYGDEQVQAGEGEQVVRYRTESLLNSTWV